MIHKMSVISRFALHLAMTLFKTGANSEEGVGKTLNNTCPEVLSHLAYVTGFEKPMKFPNSSITERDADGLFFYRLSRYLLSPEKIGLSSSL